MYIMDVYMYIYICLYDPWCWYINLHNWAIFRVNIGKYSIHGAYGICNIHVGLSISLNIIYTCYI